MNRTILIGGAWPYANGSLHIGHIAALLPGDVLARFHRACGDRVCYVAGSDCHGTPVAVRAAAEGRSPQEISDYYHEEFKTCFSRLGFSYDCYSKTSCPEHAEFVRDFHKKLYAGEYVYEKCAPHAYCESCRSFLADRFVTGTCPACGSPARGDQCDFCGLILDSENLKEPVCAVCGTSVTFRESTHLYIAVSKLEKQLRQLADSSTGWRKNAVAFTKRYLDEGLRDRALTRDLDWGIPVPKEGYENKTIYIWAENVLGYLSAAKQAAESGSISFDELFGENATHYYVHGKDNIPFHSIILPALLLAGGGGLHLPDRIVSSEYLTLEGQKISTSRNYAIWIKDLLERYDADTIRYYFLANGPEKKDADFSWAEFVNNNNSELLGAYGNFVHRSLSFIIKYLGGTVPAGSLSPEWEGSIRTLYEDTAKRIEKSCIKEALEGIFDAVRRANKFFDEEEPWKTRITDEAACGNTMYQTVQLIANFAVLLAPFIPYSSCKIFKWLNLNEKWEYKTVPSGFILPEIRVLFTRLDKSIIDEERSRL